MDQAEVHVREAMATDAKPLGLLCRRCFVKSPEWRVPMVIVQRWWRDVIEHPGCWVRVLEDQSGVIGFLVGVQDQTVWDRLGKRGPNKKWMKMLVLLTRPSFLRSQLAKRKRAKGKRRTGDCQGNGASTTADSQDGRGQSEPKIDRVRIEDVLGDQSGFYLAVMGVDPRERGRGLGKLIVEQFDRIGMELGAGVLWLHVDPRNERAQGLYKGFGYCLDGLDGHSLLMIKRVGDEAS